MEPQSSMLVATILFAVAAVGGLVMAGVRFARGANPPAALAMLHGLLGAAGLTLLLYAWYTVGLPSLAQIAVGLLVIAALGGIVLNLNYHQKGLPLPAAFVVGHAALAVGGFGCLLMAVLATR